MRYELVPDTPCPHCERPNTTLRRSIEEDGFTKVSRICIACRSEWTHTWDRDWLADAKNKKLRAENERMRAENKKLRAAVVSEVEQLHEEIELLREVIKALLPRKEDL